LTGANLAGADLNQASLYKAILHDTDLSTSILVRANLTGASYTFFTKWPEGFNPKAAGAIEVEWSYELEEWVPVNEE